MEKLKNKMLELGKIFFLLDVFFLVLWYYLFKIWWWPFHFPSYVRSFSSGCINNKVVVFHIFRKFIWREILFDMLNIFLRGLRKDSGVLGVLIQFIKFYNDSSSFSEAIIRANQEITKFPNQSRLTK